jgi:epoxyqueuosine reductase QueG
MKDKKISINVDMLQSKIIKWGADLVGFTSLDNLRGLKVYPQGLLDPFNSAVSIAIEIPSEIFGEYFTKPTPSYALSYKTTNSKLNEIALRLMAYLKKNGYDSLNIPATEYADDKQAYGKLSHKAIAHEAGLGWLGKNQLLLTHIYGPRIRLVTILTDAQFSNTGAPEKNRCMHCTACIEACPVDALMDVNDNYDFIDLQKSFDFVKCNAKVYENAKIPEIGEPICGICISVCPFS